MALGNLPTEPQERGFALRHGHLYAHRLVSRLAEAGRWEGGADDGVVRVSLLHYNTPAEVAALCAALEAVL
jgi:selenocysteine lyase/cysteine desulfurase